MQEKFLILPLKQFYLDPLYSIQAMDILSMFRFAFFPLKVNISTPCYFMGFLVTLFTVGVSGFFVRVKLGIAHVFIVA